MKNKLETSDYYLWNEQNLTVYSANESFNHLLDLLHTQVFWSFLQDLFTTLLFPVFSLLVASLKMSWCLAYMPASVNMFNLADVNYTHYGGQVFHVKIVSPTYYMG